MSGDCWLWLGTKIKAGYGLYKLELKYQLAHRVVFALLRGPIPDGFHLDHLCRNHSCVRPSHLDPVTCAENLYRGAGVAATNRVKSHCKNGHPLAGQHIYLYGNRRRCRLCMNSYMAARRKRISSA